MDGHERAFARLDIWVTAALSVRLLFASTVPQTLDLFMRGQLAWLASKGHEVYAVAAPGASLEAIAQREGVQIHALTMEREISPSADAKALAAWVRLLRATRPDICVVSTPKASLLGGVASAIVGVPRRVYMMRGARFEGTTGRKREVLVAAERLTCASVHRVIAVSPSLARVALEAGVVPARKLVTVGSGSSNGVDLVRFHPPTARERDEARWRWGVHDGHAVVAYVGRLSADKGLALLRDALGGMALRGSRVVLLMAGTDEGANLELEERDGLVVQQLGYVGDVPALLHAADMLALPTQREGFPNVVLEAAASGLPVVTTDATGAVDSVVDGVTGFVVGKRDGAAFGRALARLSHDASLRHAMGSAARKRVELEFNQQVVWEGMYREYIGEHRSSARSP